MSSQETVELWAPRRFAYVGEVLPLVVVKRTPSPQNEYAYVVIDFPFGTYEGELEMYSNYPMPVETSQPFAIEVPDPVVVDGASHPRHVYYPATPARFRGTATVAITLNGVDTTVEFPLEVRQVVLRPGESPPPWRKISHPNIWTPVPPDELAELYSA